MNPAQFGAIFQMYAILQHSSWKCTKVHLANVTWKFNSTTVTIPGFFSIAMAVISNSLQKGNFCDFQFTLETGLRHVLAKVKLNISECCSFHMYTLRNTTGNHARRTCCLSVCYSAI